MKVKFTVLLITLITVGFSGSSQAQMTFTFSDDGTGKTLITGIGSADITGGDPAFAGALPLLIGWDDRGSPTTNNSLSLLADSSFFTFADPGIPGDFFSFPVLGTNLTVEGIALEFLEMDGTDRSAPFPYFALKFATNLPQTGTVTANGGSAVVDFDFVNLPYFGQSIDLQGNGDVIFSFDAIPEPTTVSLVGLSALAGVMLKRHRTRTNKKDVIPSENMVEKW